MKWLNSDTMRLVFFGFIPAMLINVLSNSSCLSQTNREDMAAQVDAYLDDLVGAGEFSGSVLIAKHGQIIISKGYGMANFEHDVPNMPYTKFKLYSISKQFTAMAIMMLEEADLLSVQDSICPYVTNCPVAWEPITIHNLLTHTSGLRDYVLVEGSTDLFRLPKSLDMLIDLIRTKPLKSPPGGGFDYCNSNYLLLGAIIESASGKSYADFLGENIFEPLGMMNSGCDNSRAILKNRAAGYIRQGGNLENATYELVDVPCGDAHVYSTVEDMLLWDQALYTDQLVSLDTLDVIFTPHEPDSYTGGHYGYGWEIVERSGREVLQHGGSWWGFKAVFMRVPKEGVCIAVLSNFQFVDMRKLAEDVFAMAENVFEPLLVAHWPLDETQGVIAYNDASDRDGTLVGGPVWQPEGGMVAGALQFDGNDDYVITDPVLNPTDGAFSVVAWIKGGAPGQGVLSQVDGSNWLCMDSVEGYLMTELKASGRGAPGPLLSQTVITDGQWHRIGLVWDGHCRHLYVDGVEVAGDIVPLSSLESELGGLHFGAGSDPAPGTFFSGLIDDVRIYNRAIIP